MQKKKTETPRTTHDFPWFPMISYDSPMISLWFPVISYDFLWFPYDFLMISYDLGTIRSMSTGPHIQPTGQPMRMQGWESVR